MQIKNIDIMTVAYDENRKIKLGLKVKKLRN